MSFAGFISIEYHSLLTSGCLKIPNYKFSLRASLYSSKKYTAISQTWNFSPNS